MLASISGTINYVGDSFVIVENSGIGYKVFLSDKLMSGAVVGSPLSLFVHHHVREDQSDLFGVSNAEELRLFDMLLSVSGVGPKTALNVLGVASTQDLIAAIAHGDAAVLKKVSGIGTKTAERLVLELKKKVTGLAPGVSAAFAAKVEQDTAAVEALVSLGYTLQQARLALEKLPADVTDIGDQVKWALRQLSR